MKKRKISSLVNGLKGDGKTPWFMVVFESGLLNGKLYTEKTVFVTEDVFKQLKKGMELEIE